MSGSQERQQRLKAGEPRKHDTDEVPCPDCGVVQERVVMAQAYHDNPTSYYIDEECAVCGFEGVWW